MNDETIYVNDSANPSTAQSVAGGVTEAAAMAATAARAAGNGTAEFRAMIRGQPITMALLMLGLGYVIGRTIGGTSADHSRVQD